ncbi:hypothetical protein [Kineococcus aurantiacus]|uniref:Uncharacterized protein n=1 Tax=Kineococcus aurantiacus TaxID=37633 RepID=A0A7Y9DI49_9ACTN|nr:hypothetical protein [Kineococcus aurantiacus]NYD21010.1 hypothetical protein [Kineococcus aurantiacus]
MLDALDALDAQVPELSGVVGVAHGTPERPLLNGALITTDRVHDRAATV